MFSFKYWLADRAEIIARAEYAERQLVQADYSLAAKHDAMISASTRSERLAGVNAEIRDLTAAAVESAERAFAERDAALADVELWKAIEATGNELYIKTKAKLDRMTARGSNGKFGGKTS